MNSQLWGTMNDITTAIRNVTIGDRNVAALHQQSRPLADVQTSLRKSFQLKQLSQSFRVLCSLFSGVETFWQSLCKQCRVDSLDSTKCRKLKGIDAWDISGPVLTHWNETVYHAICTVYERNASEILRGRAWDGVMECWMIGPSEHEACPTIVLACLDTTAVKRFMIRIIQDEIFQKSGFQVVGRRGRLCFPGGHSNGSQLSQTSSVPIDPCGIPVDIISTPPSDSMRRRTGTVGGLVLVGDSPWYLTSAHIFVCDHKFEQSTDHGEQSDSINEFIVIEDLASMEDGPCRNLEPGSRDEVPYEPIEEDYAGVISYADVVASPEPPLEQVIAKYEKMDSMSGTPNLSLDGDWALLQPKHDMLIEPEFLVNRICLREKKLNIENLADVSSPCEPVLLQQGHSGLLTVNCSSALSLIPSMDGRTLCAGHRVWRSASESSTNTLMSPLTSHSAWREWFVDHRCSLWKSSWNTHRHIDHRRHFVHVAFRRCV